MKRESARDTRVARRHLARASRAMNEARLACTSETVEKLVEAIRAYQAQRHALEKRLRRKNARPIL